MMKQLPISLMLLLCCSFPAPGQDLTVGPPPPELDLPAFYQKHVSANGYPVVSSAKVNDYALKEAAWLVNLMLAKRDDVRQAMIDSGSRLIVMAYNEFTTEIPEHSKLRPKDFWDRRARGLGGSETDPGRQDLRPTAQEGLRASNGQGALEGEIRWKKLTRILGRGGAVVVR